ncbi:MAG: metallophosphoesterase family protein, partial [Sphaerochaetaceae bacterium]|nr:metallophosphoesterase family protein [Sphaerochaetaceae bacterium]
MNGAQQSRFCILCPFCVCCILCILCIHTVAAQDEMLGPWCTDTNQTSTVVNWASAESGPFTITYVSDTRDVTTGEKRENITASSECIAGINLSHFRLTDLLPDTIYHYQITSPYGQSDICKVQTFPNDGTISFAVFGDIQQSAESPENDRTRYRRISDVLSTDQNISFLLIVGDLVNDGTSDEEWTLFFDSMKHIL